MNHSSSTPGDTRKSEQDSFLTMTPSEQLTGLREPQALCFTKKNEIVAELDEEGKVKLEVIQTLLEPCDRATYGQRLEQAAIKLGKSKRTVQRLVKKWEEEGLAALAQTRRSDKGNHRIDDELQKFILKTYQEGNT